MAVLLAPQPQSIYFGAGTSPTVYRSNAKGEVTATVAADILALEAQGCIKATSIAVDAGLTAIGSTVTIALAAGASNGMLITVTVKDADGNTVAAVHKLELFMSGAATGTGLTSTSYSGSLVASTGALLTTLTSKKHFTLVTDANGIFAGTLTDSGKPATEYVCVVKPVGKALVVSAASGTTWGA